MPVKRCLAAVALAGLAVTAPAPAGTIRHDRADSFYTDLAANYPSVGELLFDSGATGSASGTLITPQWVLTAGHVSSFSPGATLEFFIGGQLVPVVQRVTHPNFNGDLTHGYDIGLVRLATPVITVTPAQRFTGTGFEEFDITATYVGFGRTGTGITGATQAAGTKRAGQNISDLGFNTTESQLHYLGSDFDDPPSGGGYTNDGRNYPGTGSAPLNLEYAIAPGDSGGGVFIDLGSGPLLAGVNSFITVDLPFPFGFGQGDGNPNSSYSDLVAATRVSFFNDFINATIPEPAVLSLLVPLALLLRRPRV